MEVKKLLKKSFHCLYQLPLMQDLVSSTASWMASSCVGTVQRNSLFGKSLKLAENFSVESPKLGAILFRNSMRLYTLSLKLEVISQKFLLYQESIYLANYGKAVHEWQFDHVVTNSCNLRKNPHEKSCFHVCSYGTSEVK